MFACRLSFPFSIERSHGVSSPPAGWIGHCRAHRRCRLPRTVSSVLPVQLFCMAPFVLLSDTLARSDWLSSRTPLLLAVAGGHVDCVSLLLEREADIHQADHHGLTALHLGVRLLQTGWQLIIFKSVYFDVKSVKKKNANNLNCFWTLLSTTYSVQVALDTVYFFLSFMSSLLSVNHIVPSVVVWLNHLLCVVVFILSPSRSCCAAKRSAHSVWWSRKPLFCWSTPEVSPQSTWQQPAAMRPGLWSCWALPALKCPLCRRWETTEDTHRCTGPVTLVLCLSIALFMLFSGHLCICIFAFETVCAHP